MCKLTRKRLSPYQLMKTIQRLAVVSALIAGTAVTAPHIAKAATRPFIENNILSIFSGDYFESYFDGFEGLLSELEDYGYSVVEEAFRDVLGQLGLSDVISFEDAVQEQLERGEHIISLGGAPRDLIGESFGRLFAGEQARTQASQLLSKVGQERVMDRLLTITTNTQIAEEQAFEAEAALSSQTAIKKLASISSQNTKILSGLTNEVINSRVDDAVGLEVVTGVAEQLDEMQSVHWAEQRSQLNSFIQITLGVPTTFSAGDSP